MSNLKGFQKKQLLEVYHNMVIARKLDEKEMALLKIVGKNGKRDKKFKISYFTQI